MTHPHISSIHAVEPDYEFLCWGYNQQNYIPKTTCLREDSRKWRACGTDSSDARYNRKSTFHIRYGGICQDYCILEIGGSNDITQCNLNSCG